jgi:hypothetical protein
LEDLSVDVTDYEWEGNLKMDLTETHCEGMDWTDLAEVVDLRQTLMNMAINV